MKNFFHKLKVFLEKLDGFRDRVLFAFIKPYWPRAVTPNHLTIVRIAIGVFLFVLLFYYKTTSGVLIISLFCIGAFTDMLDGSVARGLHKETKAGAILDSVADRILIIPIAVYSLFSLHRWLFLILIMLEIINALVSSYGHGKNVFLEANIFGKVKMFLQSIVFASILVFWPKPPHPIFTDILWLSALLLVISIIFKILDTNKTIRNNLQHGNY